MANILAAASGNWSNPATWTGGILPGLSDVAYANGKTIEIDQDISVVNLYNGNSGAIGGGSFTVSSSLASGQTRTINISGVLTSSIGSGTGGVLVVTATAGTVQLNVSEISASGYNTNAFNTVIVNGSGVTFKTTAKITGGGNSGGPALSVNAGTVSCGDVIGGNASSKTVYINGGTLTAGNISSTTNGQGVMQDGGNVTCGTITGSTTYSAAGYNIYSGSLNCGVVSGATGIGLGVFNGPLIVAAGAVGASAAGIYANNSTANAYISVNGPVTANSKPAIQSDVANFIRVKGPMKHGVNNTAPIFAPAWMVYANQPISWTVKNDANYPYTGNDVVINNEAASSGLPSVDDVRAGVPIGTTGILVGKLKVPPVESVAAGVPVDHSVGTAAVNFNQLVATIGDQIAAASTAG